MTYLCRICNKQCKSTKSLAKHTTMAHHITSEVYYLQYIGKQTDCVICRNPTKFKNITDGYTDTCGLKCSVILQWQRDDGTRRSAVSILMSGNDYGGRPAGSKNKQAYPMSSAVIKRLTDHPCPSWSGKKHKQSTKDKQSESRLTWFANGGKPTVAYKGKFQPKNPAKYNGNPSNIIYRSSWELKLMMYLDSQTNVISWSSEEIRIPYISPIDSKRHTYFPDFWIKKVTPGGKIEEVLIEVKPEAQMREPVPRKSKTGKPTKQYIKEVYTWGINSAKWAAAERYCALRGWTFVKMGAKDLGIKF